MTKGVNPPRDLFGPRQAFAIRDLLQSIFVAELIRPSHTLWLAFGWISDVAILDNCARQFASICPDWSAVEIRLASIIEVLISRGANINLILRDVEHNKNFIAKLKPCKLKYPERLKFAFGNDVHEKGILGDDFLLSGSMNLTFSGITINDEHLTLRTDRASVEEWRLNLEQKWKGLLS